MNIWFFFFVTKSLETLKHPFLNKLEMWRTVVLWLLELRVPIWPNYQFRYLWVFDMFIINLNQIFRIRDKKCVRNLLYKLFNVNITNPLEKQLFKGYIIVLFNKTFTSSTLLQISAKYSHSELLITKKPQT